MSSDTQSQIDRLCECSDVHVMRRKGWRPDGENKIIFSAFLQRARSRRSDVLVAGDLFDRSVVQWFERTGEWPDECKRVADELGEFKSDTGKNIYTVDGNHDPDEIVQDALPKGLLTHQGIHMQIQQNDGRNGILVLHGHVLTSYFRNELMKLLARAPENLPEALDDLLQNPAVVRASRNMLTDGVLPPFFSLLHQVGLGDPAERCAFDWIEKRRSSYAEHFAKLTEQNLQIPFPSAKDTVGLMVELMRAYGYHLGVLGHTHRKFMEQREMDDGSHFTIVNPGGSLRSDRRPWHFSEISDHTVSFNAVHPDGNIVEGEEVRWAA